MTILMLMMLTNLNCAEPLIKSFDGSWTEEDRGNLQNATMGCQKHFKDSPCVKLIHKTEPKVYRVTCGPTLKLT